MGDVDLDACARWVYCATGYREERPPGPVALLERLVGASAIRFAGSRVAVSRAGVVLPLGVPRELLTVAAGLACAIVAVAACAPGRSASDGELTSLAARILIPRPVLVRALRDGHGPGAIAAAYAVPARLVATHLRRCGLLSRSGEYDSVTIRASG